MDRVDSTFERKCLSASVYAQPWAIDYTNTIF